MRRWVLGLLLLLWASGSDTAQAAILYVDKDQTCPGTGTSATPYCAIQGAFNVVNPGDSIRIRDSATPYDAASSLSRSGTLANPILIEPDLGHNPTLRFTGNGSGSAVITLETASYITIQNLNFNGAGIWTSLWAVHAHASSAHIQGLRILGNTFQNWGGSAAQAATPNRRVALHLDGTYDCGNATNCKVVGALVQGNTFDHNRARNLQVVHSDNTIIENNTFSNAMCGEDGDTAVNTVGVHVYDGAPRGSTGTIIRNNVFRDWELKSACGISNKGGYDNLVAVWCDVGPDKGEVSGNLIYNINQGDTNVSTSASAGIDIEFQCYEWVVKNNIIHHVGYFGIAQRTESSSNPATWTQPPNQYLNNTVYAVGGRVIGLGYGKAIAKNNIVSGTPGGPLMSPSWGNAGMYTIDYNLYFSTSGDTHTGQWGADQGASPTSLATWRTQCNCDSHAAYANPLFVNTTTGQENLHLQGASPGCGTGEGGIDKGAYPCQGLVTPPLSPPTNVRVTSP